MSHGGCGETAVCSAIHAPSSLEARIRGGSQWPGGGPRLRSPPVGLEAGASVWSSCVSCHESWGPDPTAGQGGESSQEGLSVLRDHCLQHLLTRLLPAYQDGCPHWLGNKNTGKKMGYGAMPVVSALRRLRQEKACKFEASMVYRVKPCLEI